jgi:dephospho-CoA kinase
LDLLEEQGVDAVVVEYSVFKSRMESLAYSADVVIAILAPMEQRVARAVASGFDEEDVRRRIAKQITDADRVEAADVVFSNTSTPEELYDQVAKWWKSYMAQD